MPTEEELHDGFMLGDWEICPARGVMRCGKVEKRPEPLAWRVLVSLAQRDGDLVTREDLIEDAWDGRAVADDPINRAISQVRRALDDDARNPEYVETLHRRGFRLLKPVRLNRPMAPEPEAVQPVVGSGPHNRPWQIVAVGVALGLLATVYLVGVERPFWQKSVHSIAVMPFQNLTGESGDDYIAAGFKTELISSLTAVGDLRVKNVRNSGIADATGICKRFGVDTALFATVRRVGERLVVNYEIANCDGLITQSADVEGPATELHALQERLAELVSRDLGGERQQRLLKTQPTDSRAFDSYMRGLFALEYRGKRENLTEAIELFQESIALDEHYGPAYLGLATAYALMVDYYDAPLDEFNALALQTVDAGVAADPSIRDAAGSVLGFIAHKEKKWDEAEAGHRLAVNAELVDSNAFNWYSRMLASVGRVDEALVQARRAVELDPSAAVANSRLAIMLTWVGKDREADEYFERANELGAGGINHLMAYSFLLVRNGEVENARAITRAGLREIQARDDWVDPVFDALADRSLAPSAIAKLDQVDASGEIAPQASIILRAILGDAEGAMQVAQLLLLPGEVFEIELLFIPELVALREHAGFQSLLDELNISAHWAARNCSRRDDRVRCEIR